MKTYTELALFSQSHKNVQEKQLFDDRIKNTQKGTWEVLDKENQSK